MGMLNVRVSPDCETWLEAFAKGRGATKSDIAREAISALQRSYQKPAYGDQKEDDAMTPSQLARLSGILDREEPILDDIVWGSARRSFNRICFPSDFRRSQREIIRPAFGAFISHFHSLPQRTGWRVRMGNPSPPPQALHHSLFGDVEYYSASPIGPCELVEILYFSWSSNLIHHESFLDPQFSLRADSVNEQFVPTLMRTNGSFVCGQPFGIDDLSKNRIHDLLVEAFDVIAKDLSSSLRGGSIDGEPGLSLVT